MNDRRRSRGLCGHSWLRHGPDRFSGLDALRLATSEGALALGWADEISSLEVGKLADLVLLDTGSPELLAHDAVDPPFLVTFSASRASVKHVFVSGRQLVRDGELVGQDLAKVRASADEALVQLVRRSGLTL